MSRAALITGITGQDGVYFAEFLLQGIHSKIKKKGGDYWAHIRPAGNKELKLALVIKVENFSQGSKMA